LQSKDIFHQAKKTLYGSNDFEKAHQDCLLEWIDEQVIAPCGPFNKNLAFNAAKPTKPELKTMQDAIDVFMPYLNQLLEENTFISGNFITLSDINTAVALKTYLKYILKIQIERNIEM